MQYIAHKIQCLCGHLQGTLSAASVTRLNCHCQDCQAYAHALGAAERVLDDHGGTDVVTTLQQYVSITQGQEYLACLSLSGQGLLRWYASCCNTPVANTARDPKLSYVALLHTGLGKSAASLDATFGAKRAQLYTKHARGKVAASALDGWFATARIIASVIKARANGSWRHSPFFRPGSTEPVSQPHVLDAEERAQAFNPLRAAAR